MSIRRRSLTLAASAALFAFSGLASAQEIASRLVVSSGLVRPIFATHAPGDESRLFIIEKQGRIKILDLETETLNSDYFLDIDSIVQGGTSTSDERGLLGLAFHPDYQNNGKFFVCYTATAGSGDTYIRQYNRGADADHATTSGAVTIMSFDQPYSNHNGGYIEFGPDGYLYIFTGDGGSAGDPGNRAQDITNQKLGKILRIDVDNGTPYSVPADNPFVGVPGDDEIYAYGLRNPWRSAFDHATGDLWIADVGQNAREEVNYVRPGQIAGANFGWKCREGQANYSSSCGSSGPFFEPQIQYFHNSSGGYSITGGFVYRGCAIPELQGTYFYGDYVLSNLWSAVPNKNGTVSVTNRNSDLRVSTSGVSLSSLASFGQDARGEVYMVSQTGRIFKIVPADGSESCDPPPANDDCAGAIAVGEGSTAFTNVEASDSGLDMPLSCSSVNGPDVYSDVWFSFEAPATGFLTVSTCGTDFDSRLALYDASCPTSTGVYGCGDDDCGDDASVATLVVESQTLLIRVAATDDGVQGEGTLTIDFEPIAPPCPADLDGNGSVNGADLGLLLSAWGSDTYDVDGNGDGVNGSDLGIMLGAWGGCSG
ncbi:MAG: PQQ-dependent sugar dehydrogenase [Planctomycetota bacterium]|nr:PQQ-dependent sugar dehydrogenase [Planctomycetota bacterium]